MPYSTPIFKTDPSKSSHLPLELKTYVGVEINDVVIEVCNKEKESNPVESDISVKFFKQDIEREFSKDFDKALKDCNLVFMDSTITMLEDPLSFVLKMSKKVDWIYLRRTPLFQNTKKSKFEWGGMSEPSVVWSLGEDFYKKLHGIITIFFTSWHKSPCPDSDDIIILDCRNV